MKLKTLLLIFLFAVLPAFAGNLQVNVRNFTSSTIANRRVTLTLLDPGPLTAGPWLLAGDSVAQFTDTNGLTTFTNVLAGGYRLDIQGTPARSFPFGMPDTNGVTLNVSTLIGATNTNPYFYTAAQIDSLLPRIGPMMYVSQSSGRDSNPGSVAAPKQSISNACASVGRGGLVYVIKGNYTESDINFGGSIYFEDGSTVQYDVNNGQTFAVFIDTSIDGNHYTNITLNISGGLVSSNFDSFPSAPLFKFQAPNSVLNVQCRSIIGDPSGAVIYMHPDPYPASPIQSLPPYQQRLTVSADVISGQLWIGECAANVTARSYFTNTYFFLDRDTTNWCKPAVFTAPSAHNCQVLCQRPWNSEAVFNVPIWFGGPISILGNVTNQHAIAGCLFGNLIFNNCNFLPYPVNNQSGMFFLGSANTGYAQIDNVHAGQLTLNNCSVTFTNNNTNLVFTSGLNPATVGATNRILINGSFNSCFGAYAPSLTIEGSGIVNTNATFLTNYFIWNQ